MPDGSPQFEGSFLGLRGWVLTRAGAPFPSSFSRLLSGVPWWGNLVRFLPCGVSLVGEGEKGTNGDTAGVGQGQALGSQIPNVQGKAGRRVGGVAQFKVGWFLSAPEFS